jgi:hypothetical protein
LVPAQEERAEREIYSEGVAPFLDPDSNVDNLIPAADLGIIGASPGAFRLRFVILIPAQDKIGNKSGLSSLLCLVWSGLSFHFDERRRAGTREG